MMRAVLRGTVSHNDLGKTLLVPYVRPDGDSGQPGKSLGMARIADPDRDLTEGSFRILEPRPELRAEEQAALRKRVVEHLKKSRGT